jgi:hypothetical protein
MMRGFLKLWVKRIGELGKFEGNRYNVDMVIEEGCKAADHLLTMAIRALDYCPPTDMDFGTYLVALLTADAELVPEDAHGYRRSLRETFESYGIDLPATGCDLEAGTWCPFVPAPPPSPEEGERADRQDGKPTPDRAPVITYTRTNFESMLRDKEEVFRFIWENRAPLGINERSPMKVESVHSSMRQSPDGFFLRETIVTYVQTADIFAAATKDVLGFKRPEGMSTQERIRAFGGGVLILDQYGQIKYHIVHRLNDKDRQRRRLEYLMMRGGAAPKRGMRDRFASLHRARAES